MGAGVGDELVSALGLGLGGALSSALGSGLGGVLGDGLGHTESMLTSNSKSSIHPVQGYSLLQI